MQHDPALHERMTFASPSQRRAVGLSFIEPRSVDDLIRRREMVKIWMDATCGMFGRSPDFLNIMVTGLAAAAPEFGRTDQRFADNIRAYYVHARERDLCMTHTLVNPQVDRSRPVERQEKDLAAKIVKETDAGIVIRGARMVATLCAYADEILVMPSTYLPTNDEAAPYAFGFAIPVATPGLRFICRPSIGASERGVAHGLSRCRRGSTRATGWSCSTMCSCRGSASSSIAISRCATACSIAPRRCHRSCTSSPPRTWPRPSS